MNKRILVIEDEPDDRQILRDMLARADYEVLEAEDGEQALALVAKQRPDLIHEGGAIRNQSSASSKEALEVDRGQLRYGANLRRNNGARCGYCGSRSSRAPRVLGERQRCEPSLFWPRYWSVLTEHMGEATMGLRNPERGSACSPTYWRSRGSCLRAASML